jgi:hypothetical protein
MTSRDEVGPGSYFVNKKRGDCVRKVESVLPGGYYVRVRHYDVTIPNQMWDKISADYLARSWGKAISEAEARRLIPDMDERDARLDAEKVPYWAEIEQDVWRASVEQAVRRSTERLASDAAQLRSALAAMCEATANVRAAGVVKARRAALKVLAATAPTDGSEETGGG